MLAYMRYDKRLTRLNHRGQAKVRTQWSLYCMVNNIEKLSKAALGQIGGFSTAVHRRHNCTQVPLERLTGPNSPMNRETHFRRHSHAQSSAGGWGYRVI